jgi:hypothetical protein
MPQFYNQFIFNFQCTFYVSFIVAQMNLKYNLHFYNLTHQILALELQICYTNSGGKAPKNDIVNERRCIFKITNTSISSGTHTFEVQLRGRYRSSIRSESKLREVLERSIQAITEPIVIKSYMKLLESGDLLAIMRDFGMVSQSKMLD